MRYSMVKAATLALLGLGNVFLGVNAAPTGVAEVQDRSVAYGGDKLAVRAKAVPDLEKNGYKAAAGMALPGKPIVYTITKSGVQGTIDQIRIDKTEESINIMNAENANDKSKDKLFLSDIEMSLFVKKGGKKASDLAIVRFEVVVEKTTNPVIADAYKKLNKKNTDTITVTPKSTGAEKDVFNNLQKTAFGKSVDRLHSDFGSGKVTSFVITDGPVRPTLTVHVK